MRKKKKKEKKTKGTWPVTHAPRDCDTTPGQDVVNQHTHPKKRGEQRREDEKEDEEEEEEEEEEEKEVGTRPKTH